MAIQPPAGRSSSSGRSFSLGDWFQLHLREVAIGVVGLAVVGGGIFAYRSISRGNEQRADQAFYAAQAAAQSGDPQQAELALDRVIGGHEGTPAGTQAALLLAQLRYAQGKFAEGLATLRRVEGGVGEEFRAPVQALIAAGHEGQGQYAEAAAAYRRAAEQARFDEDRDSYRTELARVLALAGDTAAAVAVWEEIAVDVTSPHAPEARVRLGELQAKPVTRG
jgi:hypothetical protein